MKSSLTALSPALVDQFEAFQSRFGIFRLKAYVSIRRLGWRWLIDGTSAAKRALDILGGAVGLFLFSPVFAVVALVVKIEDGGPVFFSQKRVGRYGSEFKMYKFRSMKPDADRLLPALLASNQHAGGITFKLKRDPRVTWIGRWMRRFSVDEFPQLYNVLIGDMSLVGPRPPIPREVALYSLADRRRLAVKPGLTCLWQISGRSEIDFPGQVRLDVSYIENQSMSQDLRIIMRTVPAVIFGSGAY